MMQRGGAALVGDADLLGLSRSRRRGYWGRRIAYLPQDAATSLTPNRTVGTQFFEVLRAHSDTEDPRSRAAEMLEHVGLPARLAAALPVRVQRRAAAAPRARDRARLPARLC